MFKHLRDSDGFTQRKPKQKKTAVEPIGKLKPEYRQLVKRLMQNGDASLPQ